MDAARRAQGSAAPGPPRSRDDAISREAASSARCRSRLRSASSQSSVAPSSVRPQRGQSPSGRALRRLEPVVLRTAEGRATFAANRRVLQVEQLTHDCHIGAEAFNKLQKPAEVDGQQVSALPFGQERVQALQTVLVLFCLQPEGFRNRQLRPLLAQLLGISETKSVPDA